MVASNYRRYVIELGTGVDLHGMDITKAAKKAVKDAVSHSCLSGIGEVLGLNELDEQVHIDLTLAVPDPEAVDVDAVVATVPFGSVDVDVVAGGLEVKGKHMAQYGEGDHIIVVNACLTVYVDMNQIQHA